MIGIIDYGVGNLGSLSNSLAYLDLPFTVSRDPEELQASDKLILPGVGAFGAAMNSLNASGLQTPLLEMSAAEKPVLGICLGMQLLLSGSAEAPGVTGLNLIPGKVLPFKNVDRKIHMGWNSVKFQKPTPVTDGFAYFVHGYYCQPDDPTTIYATSDYGGEFPCILRQDNILGMQFHPEKSQRLGLELLKAYADGKL